jgi:hypothetical protein
MKLAGDPNYPPRVAEEASIEELRSEVMKHLERLAPVLNLPLLAPAGGLLASRPHKPDQIETDLCLPRFKHTACAWVDPMQLRARDTLHRLICLWIISDRWIIGPCLHLLISVGTSVAERGHDVRNRLS